MRLAGLMLLLLLITPLTAQNTQASNAAPGSVSGQVVQASNGMPLGKVVVSLSPTTRDVGMAFLERLPNNLSTVTDAEGRFQIENVGAGEYRVSLQRNGFLPTGRRSQHDSPTLVSVSRGQAVDGLLFRVQPAAVIRGKVVDEDGDAISNVQLVAMSITKGNVLGSGVTNDLGEYRIAGLPTGRYLVLAQAESAQPVPRATDSPRVYAPTYFPGTMDRSQAASLEVHPGDEAEAVFGLVVTRTFAVRGQVPNMSTGGRRAPNSRMGAIVLHRTDMDAGSQLSAQVQQDGTFEILGVLPGVYTASVISADAGQWRPTHGTETVEVRGADVEGLRLSPESMGEVRGRFRMDNGKSFNWAQLNIYLDPEDSDSPAYGRTEKIGKDGTFRIPNVPEGNYHVVVTADSNNLLDYILKEVNVNGKDAGDSGFAVGPAVTVIDVVASAKGSAIVGTLLDSDDKTVFDVPVICVPDEARRKRRDLYQLSQTDRRGHFSLRGLNAGEYVVFAVNGDPGDFTDPDFIREHEATGQRVRVDDGEQKTITLKFSWDSEP